GHSSALRHGGLPLLLRRGLLWQRQHRLPRRLSPARCRPSPSRRTRHWRPSASHPSLRSTPPILWSQSFLMLVSSVLAAVAVARILPLVFRKSFVLSQTDFENGKAPAVLPLASWRV